MDYYTYSNSEFIEKSEKLIEKLEEKQLWDKDTLVIGLDKSVRALAYTMRRLSNGEKKDTPDFRFFNYSHYDYLSSEENFKKISSYMKKKLKPDKLSKYKKILILDEYIWTGDSMNGMSKILEYYFSKSKNKPSISFASLTKSSPSIIHDLYNKPSNLVYVDKTSASDRLSRDKSGIEDSLKFYKPFLRKKQKIITSVRTSNKEDYKRFLGNRKKLSKEINQYLQGKKEDNENYNSGKSLEKAVQVFSLISLIGGIILSYSEITGSIIGKSSHIFNMKGIILIVLGIFTLIISKKFNN